MNPINAMKPVRDVLACSAVLALSACSTIGFTAGETPDLVRMTAGRSPACA
jgi:hypothetical protein